MPRNIQKPPEFTWVVQQKAAGNEQAWDASILIELSLIIIFFYIFSGYLRFTMMVLSEFVRLWKYFFLVGPESPCAEDVLRVAPRPCAVRRTCQFAGTPGEDKNRDGSALDLCSK
jgi:hypothetical protein